jgi:hypothetical protein
MLPDMRKIFSSKDYLPVYNTEYFIDNLPEDEVMNMSLREPETNSLISPTIQKQKSISRTRYVGQKFKVKLSYPENDFIDISSYTKNTVNMYL